MRNPSSRTPDRLSTRLLILICLICVGPAQADTTAKKADLELTPSEQQWLRDHPVIRLSNEQAWAPFDYMQNGLPAGYSIDLMNRVAELLGVEFRYVNGLTWAELLDRFKTRQIDVMSAIYISESRKEYALFTPPYFKNPPAIITRIDEKSIQSLEDLNSRRVALPPDYALYEMLPKEVPKVVMLGQVDGKAIESTLDALKAVVSGRADAVVESAAVLAHQIEVNALPNLKISAFPQFEHVNVEDFDLYAAVRKDWPEFHRILTKALNAITPEERLALQKKWLGMGGVASPAQVTVSYQEQAYLSRKREILYCVDPDRMPYERIDEKGRYIGMMAEFLRRVEERLGVPFRLVKTQNWAGSLQAVRVGRCQLLPAATKTETQSSFLSYTDSIYELPLVVAVHEETPFIEDLHLMSDRQVAVVESYLDMPRLRDAYPEVQLVEVGSLAEGLSMVSQKQVLGVIDTVSSIRHTLGREGILNVRIGGQLDINLPIAMAVDANSEEELVSALNKVIDSFSREELEALRIQWSLPQSEPATDMTLIWQVGTGALIVIGLVLLWNRKLAYLTRELNVANQRLAELSREDPLTGLYNRRAFMEILDRDVARAKRGDKPLSLMVIDADKFKSINDQHGHAAGDRVLMEISDIMRAIVREADAVGRLGGEEFAVVLPNADLQGAKHLAERLRKTVAQKDVTYEGDTLRVTVSIGIACLWGDESSGRLLHRADSAMYEAKAEGRNRVAVA